MREFETGATRDDDTNKIDPEGFFSPLVLRRRAEYMHKHRKQADGKLRDSDNWQRGMSDEVYMKSLFRHFLELWEIHRTQQTRPWNGESWEDTLAAIMFNAEGLLLNSLKREEPHHIVGGQGTEF